MSDLGGVQGSQDTDSQETGQDSQIDENSLLAEMLKNVPEEHKPIMEKYASDWNSSATKRFQQIHDSYAPYKGLGSVEELQQARQIYDTLRASPQDIFDVIVDEFKKDPRGTQYLLKALSDLQQIEEQESEVPAEFQGLPKEFLGKWQEQERLLQQLAQTVLNTHELSEQQRQDQMLDEYMDEMHTKHGKFDDDFFLLQLHRGADEKAAIELAKRFVEPEPEPNPFVPALSGGGIVPSGPQKVADMSNEDVDKLVAGVLAQTLGENSK